MAAAMAASEPEARDPGSTIAPLSPISLGGRSEMGGRWFPAFIACARHFPQDAQEALREAFRRYDQNALGGGRITVRELREALRSVGIEPSGPMYDEAVQALLGNEDQADSRESWGDLTQQLTQQKALTMATFQADEAAIMNRTRARSATSSPGTAFGSTSLGTGTSTAGAIPRSLSSPSLHEAAKQKSSTFRNSAKYSLGPGYGKPRHLKGKLKIPIPEPRDRDFTIPSWTPGPGAHDLPHCIGKHVKEAAGGPTGGWLAGSHDVFMRAFGSKRFNYQATPEFFDQMEVLLPDVPRTEIAEHVRWYADYERHKLRRQHHVSRLVEAAKQSQPVESSGAELQRLDEKRQLRRQAQALHQQAEDEEMANGCRDIRRPRVPAHQKFGGVEVDENLYGHPEYRKARGHTFGFDRRHANETIEGIKKHTDFSHVTSCCAAPRSGAISMALRRAFRGPRRPSRTTKWPMGSRRRTLMARCCASSARRRCASRPSGSARRRPGRISAARRLRPPTRPTT